MVPVGASGLVSGAGVAAGAGGGTGAAAGVGADLGPHMAPGLHSQGFGAGPQVQSGFEQEPLFTKSTEPSDSLRTITLFTIFLSSSGAISLPFTKARVVTITPSGSGVGAGS